VGLVAGSSASKTRLYAGLSPRVEETIVNNESIEIMEMLATAFADHSDEYDLYPVGKRDRIDAVVEELYEPILQGVYTAGFPDSQDTHEQAVQALFDAPCGSGPASHRFRSTPCYTGPHKNDCGGRSQPASIRGLWPLCPLDPRLKTEVCARISVRGGVDSPGICYTVSKNPFNLRAV